MRSTIKTDAEKSGDLLEKERQRKISEENAKAEKLRLGNLMRMVQEKIDKTRMEKEKRRTKQRRQTTRRYEEEKRREEERSEAMRKHEKRGEDWG